ncbi:TMEM165/GDT1 family protein [Pseudanabaena sp. UWO310]|uniref:TMEM165/GDT1 family protein n=1 Tax=Pseudanabaena sp. UWO310 TaxID=2480795 RepID=UPI00115B9E69|nr:TMEM165/GDT1 family protein [Pseudanabaena sp. UWO310]TYQ28861.1 TMEM165/GDT1 family protein [Pseudanabaena sp. UWO310]
MLTAFTASLLLITISELGDKTFFIAVILAMRHPHRTVFAAVFAALALMTVLSVALGQVMALFPKIYIHYGEIVLFLVLGLKLLYDASKMSAKSDAEIVHEAEEFIETQDSPNALASIPVFGESLRNILLKYSWLRLWLQAFVMTFIAEWGDRTQISTIALAASYNPVFVTLGAILGHGICTAIAVVGGSLIAGRISEQIITAIGGVLFIIFGVAAYFQGV